MYVVENVLSDHVEPDAMALRSLRGFILLRSWAYVMMLFAPNAVMELMSSIGWTVRDVQVAVQGYPGSHGTE